MLPDVEGEHLEVLAVRRVARCCISIYAIGVPAFYLILLLTVLPELREASLANSRTLTSLVSMFERVYIAPPRKSAVACADYSPSHRVTRDPIDRRAPAVFSSVIRHMNPPDRWPV